MGKRLLKLSSDKRRVIVEKKKAEWIDRENNRKLVD